MGTLAKFMRISETFLIMLTKKLLPEAAVSRIALFVGIGISLLISATVGKAQLAGAVTGDQASSVTAGHSYHNDTSMPLRDMQQLPIKPRIVDGEPREANPNPVNPKTHVDAEDTIVQSFLAPDMMPTPSHSFDGIGFPGVSCNCFPPDTNGEVGATQYVQMVNEGYQVFDKVSGTSVLGPSSIVSLWAGFGGVCQTAGDGDPILLYDQLAGRWLISQFAGTPVPTDECIAISTTSDATGSYNRYAFHLGTNFFDYPHIGVWPDGYYMEDNVFNSGGTARLGPQPFAFDRVAMLAGNPATFLTTGITGGASEPYALPADVDGTILPAEGTPCPFVEFPSGGTYRTWLFHADFVTPANSTYTMRTSPPRSSYTQACTSGRSCVPQLGTTAGLDGIGDRLMYRLTYRIINGVERIVGNHTVSSGGVTGIRWFELHNVTSGTESVFQESTYQPDSDWRWMGSAAMDQSGDIAIGFSASSSTMNPQIRYAGRISSDPLNTLGQGETHLIDGTGSQSSGGNRWGDYSAMSVDPQDDCTFWYTQEYFTSGWRTRIGSFRFPACAGVALVDPFSVSDVQGNNNGVPEPGEPLLLSIAINNSGASAVDNVQVTVAGGGSVNYGTIASGQTVTNNIQYTVPADAVCGSIHNVSISVVSPGFGTSASIRSFRLGAQSGDPVTFTNSAALTIPAGAPGTTNGASVPYPSTITVAGLSGMKTLKVRLNQLSHTSPNNIDMLLVGPGGQKMEILSDQGGTNSISNVDLTLSDSAATIVGSTIVTGDFKPTADAGQDGFVSPAPAPIYLIAGPGGTATLTSAYGTNGSAMNGDWKLFVMDDTAADVGMMAGGWSLIFESADYTCAAVATPTATPTGSPPAIITGTVTYGNAIGAPMPRFVSNVLLSGAGSTPVSGMSVFPNGNYSLSGFGAGSYTVTPSKTGGVNGISSFDSAKISQHVAGLIILNSTQLFVADTSRNGTVSSFDAGQIARYAAGIQGSGATATWMFNPPNRSYAAVNTTLAGEDYSALLMGEVSGNWTDGTPRPANGPERSVALSAPRLAAEPGKEVIVPIEVQGATEKDIIAYEFDLLYDTQVIRPEANVVQLAGTASRGMSVVANPAEPGVLRVVVYGALPVDGNGVLLNLRFTAVGTPGTVSPLTWRRVVFNEGDPGAIVTDGRVELSQATTQAARQ